MSRSLVLSHPILLFRKNDQLEGFVVFMLTR